MNQENNLLGPKKIDIQSVALASLGGFVAGAIGGMFILLCTVLFLNATKEAAPTVFPYVLSLVGLIAILISLFIHFTLQKMIFSESSNRTGSMLSHVFGFNIFGFLLLMPLYVYVGAYESTSLMLVFSLHVTLAIFGSTLITRVLTQYRYSILSIYACLVGLIAVATGIAMVFTLLNNSEKILFSLAAVVAVCLTTFSLATLLTEYLYYQLYAITGQDILGDAMDEISKEETAAIEEATRFSTTFHDIPNGN